MPFKSEKQRRYMHAQHPEIASKWQKEGKGNVAGYGKSKTTSSPKAKMAAAKGKAKKIVVAKRAATKKRGK